VSPARRARPGRRVRHLRAARNVFAAGFVVSLVVAFVPGRSSAAPVPGSAGTDTTLPSTNSEVTVSGRGNFSDLKITVNQTQDLTNQAVSVSWTGAAPTEQGPGRFGRNFLQIMQCWGDDDGTNPENPGPRPEQCEFGAATAKFGGVSASQYPNALSATRVISRSGWQNFDPAVGVLDRSTTNVWRAFDSVDGGGTDIPINPKFNPALGGEFWLNPYFNIATTNEVAAAITDKTGAGTELFTVDTGLEAPGLGCGQKVEPAAGGQLKVPKCWLVIVPRADPISENVGTPFQIGADSIGVATSPLASEAWANRISVPLGFNPVDSPCSIDAKDRRIVGTELVGVAMSSWQPALCSDAGSPPYVFGTVPDASARQQILSPTVGAPGMAIVPKAADPSAANASDPVVYAPVALSGTVIGFNVERRLKLDSPTDEEQLDGVRVADINLTPRLVAKLLTQSYRSQLDILSGSGYAWLTGNPSDLAGDPDFLRFNPEFRFIAPGYSKNFGGLVLPVLNSDTAEQVWQWILSDEEAKRWLDGQPDDWGMKVNPAYATVQSANSFGVAFAADGAPSNFPKADPYCYQAETIAGGPVPPKICGPDWLPYANGTRDAARETRIASDAAKTVFNVFAASSDQVWKREDPQQLGTRSILSVTDTASAALFGLQTAKLSRSGDDADDRSFIAAATTGLTAALDAMRPSSEPSVLETDLSALVDGAYPLASLSYAMVRPLSLDTEARKDYANFVRYVSGPGQTSGYAVGLLPPGYAPLPAKLQNQAAKAADLVETLTAPPAAGDAGSTSQPASTSSSSHSSSNLSSRKTTASTAAPSEVPVATVTEQVAAKTPDAGPLTPILAVARSRFFIPGLAGVSVLATLAALEITKRPRRPRGAAATQNGAV
jgi:hypothetical protein